MEWWAGVILAMEYNVCAVFYSSNPGIMRLNHTWGIYVFIVSLILLYCIGRSFATGQSPHPEGVPNICKWGVMSLSRWPVALHKEKKIAYTVCKCSLNAHFRHILHYFGQAWSSSNNFQTKMRTKNSVKFIILLIYWEREVSLKV